MGELGSRLPAYADTIVVGGGVGGAVVAGRLAAQSDEQILLLEAGPDYGPLSDGNWPSELLDCTFMPVDSHSWNYTSSCANGTPDLGIERARVIGGCSSHNGCAAVWGWRGDYDAWAAAGNPGWDAGSLLPLFERANAAMRVLQPKREEVTPWHRACADAGPAAGFPFLENLNDLDAELGIGFGALNVDQNVRWNSAFGYLDPVRDRPNLQIAGNALVDRVTVEGGAATGVEAIVEGQSHRVKAGRVVLCGGAYGSPLIMLRSGIGPADEIAEHGIRPLHELSGVGRNLQDHPSTRVVFTGTPELVTAMNDFVASGGSPREEGSIVLAKSSRCERGFDLHLYPIASPRGNGEWLFAIYTAVMDVKSTGIIKLGGRDPEALPIIDTGYFTDPEGTDLTVLVDGIRHARNLAAQLPMSGLCGPEIEPLLGQDDLLGYVIAKCTHDYHPASTCKMGPSSDPGAVVDHRGKVHGLDGLFVADASIMPFVARANTNIPTAVIAEKVVEGLIQN